MLLLIALAQAAPVTYEGPPCAPGSVVFLPLEAELRPEPDAAPTATLPRSTEVVAVGPVDGPDAPGAWCQVRLADGATGVLPRRAIAVDRWRADFDHDGTDDEVYVSYAEDHRILVAVTDGPVLDLGVQEDMGGTLDQAEVSVETDLPLLRVYVPGSEQCGGYAAEMFVGWPKGGTPSVVLEGRSGGDAPVYLTTEFTFRAHGKKVIRVETVGESMDAGDSEDITTTTQKWVDGSYQVVREKVVHKGPVVE